MGNLGRRSGLLFVLLSFLSVEVYAGAYFWDLTKSGRRVQRKWKTPHARWRFNPENAPAGAQALIDQAFKTWQAQTHAQVSAEYAGTTSLALPKADGYSDIFFNIDMATLGYDNNTVAVTFLNSTYPGLLASSADAPITEADIVVSKALASQFITTEATDPSQLDIVEVLAHEIGHLYGLAHSFLIDSLMFPAKPPSNATADLKSLFRTSKRSLAQDDIAFIENLYQPDDWESGGGHIEGQVRYNGKAYIGAHVVAIRVGDADHSLSFYQAAGASVPSLIVKGVNAVSAFSEQSGDFEMHGLLPGEYKLVAQDAEEFMTFSLDNVSAYLAAYNTNAYFSTQFWMNPDCLKSGTVTTQNVTEMYDSAPTTTIAADEWLCGVEIVMHQGGADTCYDISVPGGSCGGGGCQIKNLASSEAWGIFNHPSFWLVSLGFFLILLSCRKIIESSFRKRFGKRK